MVGHYTRLKVRRSLRFRQKQVAGLSATANKQLDRHIFRRWHNFRSAGRFAIGWVSLVVILIIAIVVQTKTLGSSYMVTTPVSGGVYTEGMIGSLSNINPIYATSDIDTSVSKLVFSSLFTYDGKNQIVGDLAQSWSVDSKGTTYTIKLKPNLYWSDGKPLTANDIVFTYNTIENPDAQSPLEYNFNDVTVTKIDSRTVQFALPVAYSPFLYSLTNGIVPAHILSSIPIDQLRSADFDTNSPIGSGPFVWKGISVNNISGGNQTETIQLARNPSYYRGVAKLDGITIKTYPDENSLQSALDKNQVMTAAGMDLSDQVIAYKYNTYNFNLMSANMLFLKTTSPLLSDVKVRQALVEATNVPILLNQVGYTAIPVKEPILESQVGYNSNYTQLAFNKTLAMNTLAADGWHVGGTGPYLMKNGQQLMLNLVYNGSPEFSRIAAKLQSEWSSIGVNLQINVSQGSDFQRILDEHDYDVLLCGINIGSDPDVYAYWDSSQISATSTYHLNFSEYKSSDTDLALETARSRSDPAIRAAIYIQFLKAWQNDAPAIGLYQPRYLYVSSQHIYGIDNPMINVPSDRFDNVQNWMIKTAKMDDRT